MLGIRCCDRFGASRYTNACVFYALLTNRSPVGLGGSVDGANVTLLQENAWRAYTEYKATRSAECTPERCIRFFDDDFNLNVVPTMTTTTQTTVTTQTTPLPPVETCELPADAPTEISLAESVVINGAMPAATVAPLFDRLGDVCPTVWQPCYSGSRVRYLSRLVRGPPFGNRVGGDNFSVVGANG